MLKVDNVVTRYGAIEALKGLSLEAREGQVTCLLGPNGAGKTTTLFTIAGILNSHSGSITLGKDNITNLSAPGIVRKGIALVPENRLIFPQMSVEENLIAGAFARPRKDQPAITADLKGIYERFPRLKERSAQFGGTLSGGEQQMLAIGRALMARPKMLMMDEPSLGLAPIIVQEIFDIISLLNEEGVSILLVEQNARMALKVAHHIFLLEGGRVTFNGNPQEMQQDEVIQRAYLGAGLT
jgi:branched-chain amino acid transport system ATP-binding protein